MFCPLHTKKKTYVNKTMIILHWKHIFAINFYYHFNFVTNSCITTIVNYIVNTWQWFIFCLSSDMIFVCTKCTLLRCVYAGHYAPWMPPFTLGPLNIPLDLLGPHSSPVLPYKLLEYPSNVAVTLEVVDCPTQLICTWIFICCVPWQS